MRNEQNFLASFGNVRMMAIAIPRKKNKKGIIGSAVTRLPHGTKQGGQMDQSTMIVF
ncbi:MAG: hypothetical protein R3B95_02870 [Nitrospirales bacterium]|nr:hypothetical protein [Nitrospirales bacterium]